MQYWEASTGGAITTTHTNSNPNPSSRSICHPELADNHSSPICSEVYTTVRRKRPSPCRSPCYSEGYREKGIRGLWAEEYKRKEREERRFRDRETEDGKVWTLEVRKTRKQ